MKREDLKLNVVYQLAQDVQNPKPDRRVSKHDVGDCFKWDVILKGTRFVLDGLSWIYDSDSDDEARKATWEKLPLWQRCALTAFDARHFGLHRLGHNTVLYNLIVESLELAPVTLKAFFHMHGAEIRDADDVLEALLRHRLITPALLTQGILAMQLDARNDELPALIIKP